MNIVYITNRERKRKHKNEVFLNMHKNGYAQCMKTAEHMNPDMIVVYDSKCRTYSSAE